MKQNIIAILCLIALSGCVKRYPKKTLKPLAAHSADTVQTKSDVTVMTQQWNQEEAQDFFAGYYLTHLQPVQVAITNNSSEKYVLTAQNISLPLIRPSFDSHAITDIVVNTLALSYFAGLPLVLIKSAATGEFAIIWVFVYGPYISLFIPFVGFFAYTTGVAIANKPTVEHALSQLFDSVLVINAQSTQNTLLLFDRKQFATTRPTFTLASPTHELTFEL